MSVKELVMVIMSSFRDDIQACQKMANLLVEQRVMLASADSDGLVKINRDIDVLADKLGESGRQRENALRSFGLNSDKEGYSTLFRKLPDAISSEMTHLFERLEVAMNRCHSLNEKNGELLVEQQAIIRRLLGKKATSYGEPG